jgi:hypothetical protein
MDMNKHLLIYFSYPCWWIGKKSEVVTKWRYLSEKVEDNYLKS